MKELSHRGTPYTAVRDLLGAEIRTERWRNHTTVIQLGPQPDAHKIEDHQPINADEDPSPNLVKLGEGEGGITPQMTNPGAEEDSGVSTSVPLTLR